MRPRSRAAACNEQEGEQRPPPRMLSSPDPGQFAGERGGGESQKLGCLTSVPAQCRANASGVGTTLSRHRAVLMTARNVVSSSRSTRR